MPDWNDEIVIPGLLRSARRPYGQAMRHALDEAGFDDIPRNGMSVIGGIARNGPLEGLTDLRESLEQSKQAVSQLVDSLVIRGYVERVEDPTDRRRVLVDLTTRGRAAATVGRTATETVDARLLAALGARGVASLRAGLAALSELSG